VKRYALILSALALAGCGGHSAKHHSLAYWSGYDAYDPTVTADPLNPDDPAGQACYDAWYSSGIEARFPHRPDGTRIESDAYDTAQLDWQEGCDAAESANNG
jgi:hypothetical protein